MHHYAKKVTDILMAACAFIAVALSLFQIYESITIQLSVPIFRPIYLGWILVLVFMVYPLIKSTYSPVLYIFGRFLDIALGVTTILAAYAISTFNYDDIGFLLDGLKSQDKLAGMVLMVLLLEATRRTVGMTMGILALLFMAYAFWGDALPANIASKGFTLEEIIRFHIFSTNGVFGTPLAIASSVVFVFLLFGAFLQVTGAGQFFIDMAFALTGQYRGGPAKASVIASAALGSISGSAISNTVTTGTLTIPMMKKLGYKSTQAAGIEAAASTGGGIMPPIMGAGAFVMAQFTGLPYGHILMFSIAPALLYFICTLLYVHLMACKLGFKGMTSTQKTIEVLKAGWHFLLPLGLVVKNYIIQ